MGIALLVWLRPLFSKTMYDERLRQAGSNNSLVLLWFRAIGSTQRLAFGLGGLLLLAVGIFGLGRYLIGFWGLNPLRIVP